MSVFLSVELQRDVAVGSPPQRSNSHDVAPAIGRENIWRPTVQYFRCPNRPLKLDPFCCDDAFESGRSPVAKHGVTITARHDLSIAGVEQLEDRLYDQNRRAIGHDDGKRLAFVAHDADGRQWAPSPATPGQRWPKSS